MSIVFDIKTIEHRKQRYPTAGDWQPTPMGDVGLKIRVSRLPKMNYQPAEPWKMEALIAVHELIEAILCRARGIKSDAVDAFDIAFEEEKKAVGTCTGEPGDDPAAPYFKEHQFATVIEKMLALELDVNWNIYCMAVEDLEEIPAPRRKR